MISENLFRSVWYLSSCEKPFLEALSRHVERFAYGPKELIESVHHLNVLTAGMGTRGARMIRRDGLRRHHPDVDCAARYRRRSRSSTQKRRASPAPACTSAWLSIQGTHRRSARRAFVSPSTAPSSSLACTLRPRPIA